MDDLNLDMPFYYICKLGASLQDMRHMTVHYMREIQYVSCSKVERSATASTL